MIVDIRTQTELATKISEDINDEGFNRWSLPQIYRGINNAVSLWSQRILFPRMEVFPSDGYGLDEAEYVIPPYVIGAINLLIDRYPTYNINGYPFTLTQHEERWEPLRSYNTYYREDGKYVVQTSHTFDSRTGRLVWWFPNSRVPAIDPLPVLHEELTDTATSLTLTPDPLCSSAGFIKVGDEIMSYAGIEKDGLNTILNNLHRGIMNTDPAAHSIDDTVNWCIAVNRPDLYEHMSYETMVYLHMQYMNKAAAAERQHHFDQIRYYKQVADEKWQRIPTTRPTRVMLDRNSSPNTWG